MPFPIRVIVSLLGLSRDDEQRVWRWSEAAIPGATDWTDHVALGFAPHFCLGAALARIELAVVLGGLLDRFAGISLPADTVVERSGSSVIGGVRRAEVVLDKA